MTTTIALLAIAGSIGFMIGWHTAPQPDAQPETPAPLEYYRPDKAPVKAYWGFGELFADSSPDLSTCRAAIGWIQNIYGMNKDTFMSSISIARGAAPDTIGLSPEFMDRHQLSSMTWIGCGDFLVIMTGLAAEHQPCSNEVAIAVPAHMRRFDVPMSDFFDVDNNTKAGVWMTCPIYPQRVVGVYTPPGIG